MKSRALLLVACAASLAAACSLLVDTTDLSGGPTTDAGTAGDAPIETGTAIVDAASDAGPDAVSDAGLDANTDANADTDAGAATCKPEDPLDGPVALINELNDSNFRDRGGRITPDGKYLLFSRTRLSGASDLTANIYVSERVGGTWATPQKLPQLEGVDADGGRTNEGSPMFVPGPTPRIIFSSDRRVALPDGGSYFASADFYYANVKSADFTDIDKPVRIEEVSPTSWNSGGLEGEAFFAPSANGDGTGRAFFTTYVANNHADLFYLDYDNSLVGTPRQPLTPVNLPAYSNEESPAFANGFLYFSSTRVPLPDGGPDILADGAVNVDRARVWASKAFTSTPPTFGPPVLVTDLNSALGNTQVTWVSADGCSLVLSSDRPGGSGPAGTFHLYTAKRKPKKP